MISLYIHIPFCAQKCKYCSFQILPLDKIQTEDGLELQEKYVQKLCQEIIFFAKKYEKRFGKKEEIKTLYFGGGTPSIIGFENIDKIIQTVFENYDIEFLEEVSIELNPYPTDEILNFVKKLNKKYKKIYRLRYSFGLQSLKTLILQQTGRDCTFAGITDFLRKLQPLKQENNVFNADFIAFGDFKKLKNGQEILRNQSIWEFYENFVKSSFFDSFSIYTLELQNGNEREKPLNHDKISDEFHILKSVVEDSGYGRYEISNFAKSRARSSHNMVYRGYGDWIGFGTSATSFVKGDFFEVFKELKNINLEKGICAIRKTNTYNIFEYLENGFENITNGQKIEKLTKLDIQIEKVFLGLRMDLGVNISEFDIENIFVKNWKDIVLNLEKDGLLSFENGVLKLTGDGMNVYNGIITELLQKF